MSVIKSHDITLYSGGDIDIVLRPLCDGHLPMLYKWNADPEVLYWVDGKNAKPSSPEDVHGIWGMVSPQAFCFLIEADDTPVGECWLQEMREKQRSLFCPREPKALDVRRIDISIGEKAYWNKGIGAALIRMLVDFAFNGEYSDVLYGIVFDYNKRSRRVFEKNGFKFIEEFNEGDGISVKYRLTRQEYIERRREKIPAEKLFMLPIADLQPSQLYISEGKLRLLREWFEPDNTDGFDPIPIKRFNDKYLMTDGHTRAVAAYLAGWDSVPVYWDEDGLDMRAYAIDVKWCGEENIHSPADLAGRIVPHKDFERLWRKRCMEDSL
ncbi:MAG: GNAT family N-acetyltransferase [Oscillospiraceae bacterium]|nr:GNAT family N-acetyltransferase [Oscillospiraceae bacterium]